MKDSDASIRIVYKPTNELIAEGKLGWEITPFEGNLYISKKALRTDQFKVNFLPGLCIYKFLYVWLDFRANDGSVARNIGWTYWLPNPLLPFIWFRTAVSKTHMDIEIFEP